MRKREREGENGKQEEKETVRRRSGGRREDSRSHRNATESRVYQVLVSLWLSKVSPLTPATPYPVAILIGALLHFAQQPLLRLSRPCSRRHRDVAASFSPTIFCVPTLAHVDRRVMKGGRRGDYKNISKLVKQSFRSLTICTYKCR